MTSRPRASASPRVRAAVCAAVLLAGVQGDVTAQEEPHPFRFRELSVLSGGTIDFGDPKSSVGLASGGFVDVDGDGWDDLVTLTGMEQPSGYFLNRDDGNGGRTFVPAPAGNGLDDGAAWERDGIALAAGDVDADGDTDLFIGTGWNPDIPSGTNILLLNDGTGRFTDATAAVGLLDGDNTTGGVAFFDLELDGDLDLISINSNYPGADKCGDGRTHLWRNQLAETGALSFVDEAEQRGLDPAGPACWAVITPDYDNDGDFDVLVTHDVAGVTQLYRNDGNGHFVEVTDESGSGHGDDDDPSTFGDDARAGMGAAAVDFDNDGDLDLYITNQRKNPLYVNHADGTFHAILTSAGMLPVRTTWGCTFVDFDLDGVRDLYVAGGPIRYSPGPDAVRSYCYQGVPGGTFRELWSGAGFRRDVQHREMGTATSDFDRDGRPDLLVVRGEWEGGSPYLYRNESDTPGRRWLAVAPEGDGVRSNLSAIGARIRVLPRDAERRPIAGLTQLHEVASGDSRAAMSSLTHNFGLGAGTVSADVEVIWPRAGSHSERTNRYPNVPLDTVLHVRDDTPEHWRLAPDGAASVDGGRTSRITLEGTGPGVAQITCSIVSGSGVAAIGPVEGGAQTLDLSPPQVQEPTELVVEILARLVGVAGTGSRQVLRVAVAPTPLVDEVRVRRRGRRLVILGRGLPAEPDVVIDGVVAEWVRAPRKQRKAGGDVTELRVRVPKSVRRGFRKHAHVVEVIHPKTLASSGPVAIPATR